MGNQCQTCCESSDLKLGVLSSQNFDKLIHSKLVEKQFPEDSIPETVKEKIKLLQIQPQFTNSEIWKYEQADPKPEDSFDVAYAIVSKVSNQSQSYIGNQSQQNINANKNVPSAQMSGEGIQRKVALSPERFQTATIFLFKSQKKDSQKKKENQNQNISDKKLTLKKVYHGPINPMMRAADATIILENGQYYKGNVYEFNLQGKGSIKNALGNHTYEGGWHENKPEGQGVEQLQDKFKYEGEFKNGKWDGKGKLTLFNMQNRFRIDGSFENGTVQGPGKIYNKYDRLVYDGLFKNGKQHGQGKWFGPNGQIYEGEFHQGKKEGFGKYFFRSGKCYEGNFKDGMPDGEGQLIDDESRVKGYWYKGSNILTHNEGVN